MTLLAAGESTLRQFCPDSSVNEGERVGVGGNVCVYSHTAAGILSNIARRRVYFFINPTIIK